MQNLFVSDCNSPVILLSLHGRPLTRTNGRTIVIKMAAILFVIIMALGSYSSAY